MSTETKEQFTFDSKEWVAVVYDCKGIPAVTGYHDSEGDACNEAMACWMAEMEAYEQYKGINMGEQTAPPIWEVYKRQRTEVGK